MEKPGTKTPDETDVRNKIEEILQTSGENLDPKEKLRLILGCIDLTSLEGNDTKEKVISVCRKARNISWPGDGKLNVAAVCFYPVFIQAAKKELRYTDIKVAAVAGGFPSGQSPLMVRVDELKFCLDQGADEIDMVISRGKFLEGEYSFVYDEIAAFRQICGKTTLKVILETGELGSLGNVRKASEIAIDAGADFIKTSTGKISPAATPEAFFVMAETIRDHFRKTGKKTGIKPAGGITDPHNAMEYLKILESVNGKDWMNNQLFRIGASRLLDKLVELIR